LDPGDLGPHQLTEKRQALAAQEQRQRVLVVLAGRVRVPLRAVPNAQAGIRQRLAQNRLDQGDVALDGVGASRGGSDGMGTSQSLADTPPSPDMVGPLAAPRRGPTALCRRKRHPKGALQ
jgi:hypothetical protein